MDEAKKLSEDVGKSTGEFMKLFSEKYIASTVGNKLKDHIKTTLTKSYQDASDVKIDEENKQEAESDKKEAEEIADNKEAEKPKEAIKNDEAESDKKAQEVAKEPDKKVAESKEAEPAKEKPKEIAKEVAKEVAKPKENAKQEAEADKKAEEPKEKEKEKEQPKEKEKDIKQEAEPEPDKKVDIEVEETKEKAKEEAPKEEKPKEEAKIDEKEDEKEETKEQKKSEEIEVKVSEDKEFEYKASHSTGVYGAYALSKAAEGTKLQFPLICCSVIGYTKQLMDGGGNEYNAFNILYYKLSINESNPSGFGIKLARYSRLRDYHESICKNTKVKNLKFPSKSLAFWKKNDDEFLETRKQELDAYFVQSVENEMICTNDIFSTFLGLTQDIKKVKKIKIFTSSLAATCNGMNYVRLPTNSELNRFDTEQDMLLFSVMIDVNTKVKDDVAEIISKQNEKLKSPMQNKINKLMAVAVQKVVNPSWIEIEKTRELIGKQLDDVLENNTDAFDVAMTDLMGKIKPIIEKKLGKKKEKKDDEEDVKAEEKEEKKVDELILKIEETKSLNAFINNLGDEKEKEKAFNAYKDSFNVLIEKEKKDVIAQYLFEIFEFSYGKYIKEILAKTYDKYEGNMKVICGVIARLIQASFDMISCNLLLIFAAMDNKTKGKVVVIELLQKMGENIANVVADLDAEISLELGCISPSSSSLIVQQVSVVSGIVGNLLCCVVKDYYEDVDLQESVAKNLNTYLPIFCECILETIYKSVLSVLLDEIKKEIKDDIDKVVGDKLEFDFIPDALPKSIPQDILESMIDVIIAYLLQKNMKNKRKELNSKLYQIIRSN